MSCLGVARVSDLLCGPLVPGHQPQRSHHCHRLLITVHPGNDVGYDRALEMWGLLEEQFEGDRMIKKDKIKV